jgi:hypothetical protein
MFDFGDMAGVQFSDGSLFSLLETLQFSQHLVMSLRIVCQPDFMVCWRYPFSPSMAGAWIA